MENQTCVIHNSNGFRWILKLPYLYGNFIHLNPFELCITHVWFSIFRCSQLKDYGQLSLNKNWQSLVREFHQSRESNILQKNGSQYKSINTLRSTWLHIILRRTITGIFFDFGGTTSIRHKMGAPRPIIEWKSEDMMSYG